MAAAAELIAVEPGPPPRLRASGRWEVAAAERLGQALGRIVLPAPGPVVIDMAGVEVLDTAGAWLLHRTLKRLEADGVRTELANLGEAQRALLDLVSRLPAPAPRQRRRYNAAIAVVYRLGAGTLAAVHQSIGLLNFLGVVSLSAAANLLRPWRWRWTALAHHMEQVGFNAMPIIALISFLIGVVMAYQGAAQLQKFGAQLFVVNLVAISVLREIGILLTAIVVAGRSGSAFTAQLGSMVVNEEVDAMRAMGFDPIEVLVLPRLLALVITLPLLAFVADFMGLLGGLVMCWSQLEINPWQYIDRLQSAVGVNSFWIGIIKAPVFAALIALIGSFQGLSVEGGAEAVGRHTTRSVVESIFLVIVADAMFSVLFQTLGI